MRSELLAYLKSVDAKFPQPDPRYNEAAYRKRMARIQGPGKERLEVQHANYLKSDWKPNQDWWGSTLD